MSAPLAALFAFSPDLRACIPESTATLAHFETLIAAVEARLWRAEADQFDVWFAHYRALHIAMKTLCDATTPALQHDFLLAITVADRPRHVQTCLASVLAQCEAYGYGGRDAQGRFARVTVVLAEDSRDPANVAAHRALAENFTARGLTTLHCDLPEQVALLHALPATQRTQLARLLTDQPPERFWRKGQAANRNLAYLKLRTLARDPANTLYYLVDSDQAFEVNVATRDGERVLPAFSVFHAVSRLFREHDLRMLTGKLVGDPPVSPTVMAANFLEDVTAFLRELATLDLHAPCSFHDRDTPAPGEAAYHDHAGLFGLGAQAAHYAYRCPLSGDHDHAACLDHFSLRLRRFFFGEHPTRRTHYCYGGPLTPAPARTVYPGNYIVDDAGLKYLIPFGHLRLRMSGPTAGRLIQAEIGARFASVNLPMLHRRTTDAPADEFRPGVKDGVGDDGRIDISDEFERQFFGDLMLFSVVEWLARHPLAALATDPALPDTVATVEADLLARYREKRTDIAARRVALVDALAHAPAMPAPARARIAGFLADIEANFGAAAPVWQQLESVSHRAHRRDQIVDALRHYQAERAVWDAVISARQ